MNEITVDKAQVPSIWRLPLILTSVLFIYLLLIYFPTSASFVNIWNSSETFAHGYLILPIVIWLIWQNKTRFTPLIPEPSLYAIPLIFIVSTGWLVAYFIDVQVVQQLALVALIPLIVFGMLGWQVVKTAAFPLFFLIFAVPMGAALVPYLIDFTADFTVRLVQMTGIPIYREGTFFQLPTGNWSVVEACSGVRYLIASVTLGFLYAYLNYQSPYRRALFILVAIIVPIFANGLRAFMIVMIGHFSGMKLATGVDHLIYGWLFFGIVIAIMFYIGSFWSEDIESNDVTENKAVNQNGVDKLDNSKHYLISFVILVVIISLLPIRAYTNKTDISDTPKIITAPTMSKWRQSDQSVSDWSPRYKNMDAFLHQNYQQSVSRIDLFIGYYAAQRDGAQLITSVNGLTEEKDIWQNIGQSMINLNVSQNPIAVPLVHLKSGINEIYVAYFHYLDGRIVTNDYVAKLIEAKSRFFGGDQSASIIAISLAPGNNSDLITSEIQRFFTDMQTEIFKSIRDVNIQNGQVK